MDSPDPLDNASSRHVPPEGTPNSDFFASPVPVPSTRNPTRTARRAGHRRAKPSFFDLDDINDDSNDVQGHDDQDKPPTTGPRNDITPDRLFGSSNFNSAVSTSATRSGIHSRREETPNLGLLLDLEAPATVLVPVPPASDNDNQDDHHDSFRPESPLVSRQSTKRGQQNSSMRKDTLYVAPTSSDVEPRHPMQQKIAAAMHGTSVLDSNDTDLNENPSSQMKRVARSKVKLPPLDLETHGPDDGDSNVDVFSLSAVPQSRGNSPAAVKMRRKTATKRQSTKAPGQQPRKEPAKQSARRQKKPRTSQAKPRKAVPVKQSPPLSSSGPDYEEDLGGSDLQGDERPCRPTTPRPAKFNPLKSPVNQDLDPTQDIITIHSSSSESFDYGDDIGDDDFVPTSSLVPSKTDPIHSKTRSATQGGPAKDTRKNLKDSKAEDVNTQQRETKILPLDDDVPGLKPKARSKQLSNAVAADKGHADETDARPKTRLNKVSVAASSVLSQAKQADTSRHAAGFRAAASNLPFGKSAALSTPPTYKSGQTKSRGVDKPHHAHQADSTNSEHSRHVNIVSFDQNGPKIDRWPQRTAKAAILKLPDQNVFPSTEDEASTTAKAKSTTVEEDVRKQQPNNAATAKPFPPLRNLTKKRRNLQQHYAQNEATGGADRPLLAAMGDAHVGVSETMNEERAGTSQTLMSVTSEGKIFDDRGTATSDEGLLIYPEDDNVIGILEPYARDVNKVFPDNTNKQSPADTEELDVVKQAKDSLQKETSTRNVIKNPTPLKRRFPESGITTRTAHANKRASGIQINVQPVSTSRSAQRRMNKVVPPVNVEPVLKKARFDGAYRHFRVQEKCISSGPAPAWMLACNSSDDMADDRVNAHKTNEPMKRAAFVQRRISNDPGADGLVRIGALRETQLQPVDYSPAVKFHQRARTLRHPDEVAQKVLAAITAPAANETLPRSSNDRPSQYSAHDEDQDLMKQTRLSDMDDRGRAWKKATEPYRDGLGDTMHKTVNVNFRNCLMSLSYLTYGYTGNSAKSEDEGGGDRRCCGGL